MGRAIYMPASRSRLDLTDSTSLADVLPFFVHVRAMRPIASMSSVPRMLHSGVTAVKAQPALPLPLLHNTMDAGSAKRTSV